MFLTKCGYSDDKSVIPPKEMVQKIRAATDVRSDEDFVIIARTGAWAVEGFEAAVEQLYDYFDAGADVLFFEAPTSKEELRKIGDDVPMVANLIEGGETPLFTADEFENRGFDIVMYPATCFKATAQVFRGVYLEIDETIGHLAGP